MNPDPPAVNLELVVPRHACDARGGTCRGGGGAVVGLRALDHVRNQVLPDRRRELVRDADGLAGPLDPLQEGAHELALSLGGGPPRGGLRIHV